MPHGINRDPGSAADPALSRVAGQADGADEEPGIRAADGKGRDSYQAAAAQGRLLYRADVGEQGDRCEYPATAEAEPRAHRTRAEAGLCAGQFARARPFTGRG